VPLAEPRLTGNARRYLLDCLDTGWVSSAGPYVERFERALAHYLDLPHAVATASGTAALHLALRAAGIGPGQEVLVPTLTFIATANAVRYTGARPVLVDAEPRHAQMDPELVHHFLTRHCRWHKGRLVNRQTGRSVRAIVPVHLLGHTVEMEPIRELARRYELIVIEDAAQALGALYQDRPAGTWGDAACFSFNGNKVITTGGGGMVVTRDPQLARRARHLSTQAKADAVEYVHDELGYNYRLPNLLAALGCAQMEELEDFLAAKRALAAAWRSALADLPGLRPLEPSPHTHSSWWLFTVEVDPALCGLDARRLMRRLAERGIQTRPLWQPLHLSPVHADCQAVVRGRAERLWQRGLSLPSSVGLDPALVPWIAENIRECIAQA
jgi:perosamine synthetase